MPIVPINSPAGRQKKDWADRVLQGLSALKTVTDVAVNVPEYMEKVQKLKNSSGYGPDDIQMPMAYDENKPKVGPEANAEALKSNARAKWIATPGTLKKPEVSPLKEAVQPPSALKDGIRNLQTEPGSMAGAQVGAEEEIPDHMLGMPTAEELKETPGRQIYPGLRSGRFAEYKDQGGMTKRVELAKKEDLYKFEAKQNDLWKTWAADDETKRTSTMYAAYNRLLSQLSEGVGIASDDAMFQAFARMKRPDIARGDGGGVQTESKIGEFIDQLRRYYSGGSTMDDNERMMLLKDATALMKFQLSSQKIKDDETRAQAYQLGLDPERAVQMDFHSLVNEIDDKLKYTDEKFGTPVLKDKGTPAAKGSKGEKKPVSNPAKGVRGATPDPGAPPPQEKVGTTDKQKDLERFRALPANQTGGKRG